MNSRVHDRQEQAFAKGDNVYTTKKPVSDVLIACGRRNSSTTLTTCFWFVETNCARDDNVKQPAGAERGRLEWMDRSVRAWPRGAAPILYPSLAGAR